MALEFHILKGPGHNHQDYSEDAVSFEEIEYQELIRIANEEKLPLIAAMTDYYGEYRIVPSELDSLLTEIKSILSSVPEGDIRATLSKFEQLVSKAKLENLPIATLPD